VAKIVFFKRFVSEKISFFIDKLVIFSTNFVFRIIGSTSTKSNILLDVDCYLKKGFSVTDVDGFLKQFRKIAGSDVRIHHGFEF
jgi:hypothetical protein